MIKGIPQLSRRLFFSLKNLCVTFGSFNSENLPTLATIYLALHAANLLKFLNVK
jgi:hypothetical protein